MFVPDKYTIIDIIASFYGVLLNSGNYPDWKHSIKIYACKDFLGLDNNDDIFSIKIPNEGFDLLLSLWDINKTHEMAIFIINNIPTNYDIQTLPKDLMEKNNYINGLTFSSVPLPGINLFNSFQPTYQPDYHINFSFRDKTYPTPQNNKLIRSTSMINFPEPPNKFRKIIVPEPLTNTITYNIMSGDLLDKFRRLLPTNLKTEYSLHGLCFFHC